MNDPTPSDGTPQGLLPAASTAPAVAVPVAPASAEARAPLGRVEAPATLTLGARLRAARESAGRTVAGCATELHLPRNLLEQIEADDFGEPLHLVFVRGAVRSYSRLLGVPAAFGDEALRAAFPDTGPVLVSAAHVSTAGWLLQRYRTAATAVVLTVMIALPLVWLGLRGGLGRSVPPRIVSLEQAPAAAPVGATAGEGVAAPPAAPTPAETAPLRASMSPLAALDLTQGTASAPVAAPPVVSGTGPHTLQLAASEDCWFEIVDAAGDTVASGTLHNGESRVWHTAGPLRVTVGNASGIRVTEDGQPLPLDALQRANVARFDAFGAVSAGDANG